MRKSFYVLAVMALLAIVGCNRFRLKTDHSKQMEQVRIPVDTAQKNDIKETTTNDDWEDEPLLEIPDIPGEAGGHPDASEAERMFREGY
ncbi:MAG: hypothetical protein IJ548_06645 [Paludibacteraceae bacterium]|nr:hypothetical protein [Prevotella sp.]MBQ8705955.1 hypothetical protein [Paludibacteraceae bacterium]MBQ8715172.1 hypothetical protein [Prevotella sp.]